MSESVGLTCGDSSISGFKTNWASNNCKSDKEGAASERETQPKMMSSSSGSRRSSVWEIEEGGEEEEVDCCKDDDKSRDEEMMRKRLSSIGEEGDDDQVVYVVVGKSTSSMDALLWTINHCHHNNANYNNHCSAGAGSSSSSPNLVFLIHVFPPLRSIPTPLGKIPISQVNPEQKESYMSQERSKRREFLQKFLDVCSVSKVKVDTILIESDMEAKALLELIPILNIRKLVLGTNKSSLSRKLRSGRGNGIVDEVLEKAPEYCEVKIICEGVAVTDCPSAFPSLNSSPLTEEQYNNNDGDENDDDNNNNNSFGCTACFKPKVNR